MSSILKALKRIEGQSPPPQSFPALPDAVDAKQAVNSNTRKRRRRRRIITVSLVLLVIVVIAVIVFQRRQFVTSIIFPAGSPAAKQPKSNAPEQKSRIFRVKIPPTTVEQAPKKQKPTRSARQQIKTVSNKQPPSGTTANKPARKQSSRQKFKPSKKSIAGKRTATREPGSVTKKTKSYAKLNDSKIKLQALAWSSDTARRMVVINGRILHEGESMEGYQINQIRQEDVIVSDGRQSWSLEFGLKQ